MISVHDLQQGQKVDSQDVNGDWHTATIQSVKRKVKKPYAIITWDQYPSSCLISCFSKVSSFEIIASMHP